MNVEAYNACEHGPLANSVCQRVLRKEKKKLLLTLSRPLDINYVLEQRQGHGHLSKYLISGLIFHFFHVYMKKKLQTLLKKKRVS